VIVNQRQIILQFVITNKGRSRVYVTDARSDPSQKAFLGSGNQLNYPEIASLTFCNSTVDECIANPYATGDLGKYSYLEPGDSVGLSMLYRTQLPVNENDTISLSVALIARFTTPGTDPSQAGKPNPLRFNFPSVRLDHH
jgi:hypothetical protein